MTLKPSFKPNFNSQHTKQTEIPLPTQLLKAFYGLLFLSSVILSSVLGVLRTHIVCLYVYSSSVWEHDWVLAKKYT